MPMETVQQWGLTLAMVGVGVAGLALALAVLGIVVGGVVGAIADAWVARRRRRG